MKGQDTLGNQKINQLSHILLNDLITKVTRVTSNETRETKTSMDEELEWLVGQHSRV